MQTAQYCFRPMKSKRYTDFAVLPEGLNRDKQMKGAANETSHQMAVRKDPKPTAPTAQLQTKPCHPNSPGEGAVYFPSGAIRNQTQDHNRLTKTKP
jgi:hypothetical protein